MNRKHKDGLVKKLIIALVVTALLAVSVVFMGAGTLMASVPFTSESLTSHIPGMDYVYSVAWNGSYWLIGGESSSGSVNLVRYDGGSTYTNLTSSIPSMSIVTSIAWNGSYWLIGGTGLNPTALVKYDGISFTELASPMLMNVVNSIAWNGSYWLIGGWGPSTLVKYDGGSAYTDLTSHPPTMTTVTSIAWNGSYWLIGGGHYPTQTLLRYDGTDFTDLTTNIPDTLVVNSVAWGDGYWLIGGEGGVGGEGMGRLVKYNGSAFTDLTANIPGMGYVYSLAWNGSYWLIVGYSGSKCLVKYDGDSIYTDLTSSIPNMSRVRSVAWSGGYWLVGGQSLETLYKLTAEYTITPSAGPNGTISPGTPQTVNFGGSKTFNFTANAGYHIDNVKVDGSSVGHPASYEFTNVTSNHPINVTFAINQYTITATAGSHGSISPATQKVDYGSDATINITPENGYKISSITDNGISKEVTNPYIINNVTNNHTLVVTFIQTQQPDSTWYLAEGTTAWGFSTYISIENPNTTAVNASITYMTNTGNVSGGTLTLPAKSQTTVNPVDTLGNKDFSTKVECSEGLPIAVDRTMEWTGPGAAAPEGHSSIGVNAPAKTWYLPEGSSKWGFECWLLIQNPNSSTANCTITYMIEGEGPKTVSKSVPANTRQTFNIADDIGEKDASIKVESDQLVISERAMYRNNRREGHDSIGVTTPAEDYFLAEGTSAWGFTTYVLVQNPNNSPTDVTVTYMTPTGPKLQTPFSMDANSRKTIRVNDIPGMESTDFSTQIHGTKPIIAERSMYWGADTPLGEACHDSVGMDSAHTSFYLPDGQTSEGRETWTLVQNPNSSPVTVEISYMTPTGTGDVVFTDSIPSNSRKTYNMVDKISSGRAAIMVTSKTTGKKIMVERAMYWNQRGAGTDTIGGFSD